MLVASGIGIIEVLELFFFFFILISDIWLSKDHSGWSFSVLGAAGTQRLPWMGSLYLYCQVHQTLKRPPSLGSFSISQLLVPECGERGHSDVSTSCVWLSSTTLLPWLPSFPPKVFPVMITSLTFPQALSPQSTGDFTLELLSNPYATALRCLAFQETCVSVQGT